MRSYSIYGVTVRSASPLWSVGSRHPAGRGVSLPISTVAEVEFRRGTSAALLQAARAFRELAGENGWYCVRPRADGSFYIRWRDLFDFLISPDGRHVEARAFPNASKESFHTYLLSHVLSFALLKQGVESLHGTVVIVDGAAVVFLGNCGYGKSSLGAAFVHAGYRLLTDDMVVLGKAPVGGYYVFPGQPRMKLYPKTARKIFGQRVNGARMNPKTRKLIMPLGGTAFHSLPAPLKAIYALRDPSSGRRVRRITIRPLSRQRGAIELFRGAFNLAVSEPERLRLQFEFTTELARSVPVKQLNIPRQLRFLQMAVKAVVADLKQ